MDLRQFYDEVIDDFAKRLKIQLAHKEQQIDEERIDSMKGQIKKKMINPMELFDSAISVRHSSLNRDLLTVPIKNDSVEESKVKKQQGIQSDEENEDDLELFNKKNVLLPNNQNEEEFIKKEEISPEEIHEKIEREENDENRLEEEEREQKEQVDKLKQDLSIHISGMYEKKKHIAKDELIKLQLENVFIKIKNQNSELFYGKMTFQLKHT